MTELPRMNDDTPPTGENVRVHVYAVVGKYVVDVSVKDESDDSDILERALDYVEAGRATMLSPDCKLIGVVPAGDETTR